MLPGRPGDLPDDPRPPRPRPVRPVDAAPGGHRRGHGAGRDDPPHGVRADVQDDRHRLRADRVDAASPRCAATPTTPRPSPTPPAGPSPTSRCVVVDDDGKALGRGRARRGRRAGLQRDGGLLRRRRPPPPRPSTPTAGCTPATSACSTSGGNLKITDRTKDMFVVGGFNAYPAEIENMLMAHPSVGQVAVIGVPDHRMGEVGQAYVVPRAGATVDEAELIAWCPREDGQLQGAALGRGRRRPAAQRHAARCSSTCCASRPPAADLRHRSPARRDVCQADVCHGATQSACMLQHIPVA